MEVAVVINSEMCKVSDWHQSDHCKHSVSHRPDALPIAQPTVSTLWKHFIMLSILILMLSIYIYLSA